MEKRLLKTAALLTLVAFFVTACAGRTTQTTAPEAPEEKEAQVATAAVYQPPHQNPGPAVDRIEFRQVGADEALALLQGGEKEIDISWFGSKITAAKKIEEIPLLKAYRAPASTVTLIMNPAPATRPDELNPFSIPEVRQAMNYLINRAHIVSEFYGGLAVPMTAPHVGPLDPDYLTVNTGNAAAIALIAYDFDRAKAKITEAMRKAGAELQDNSRPPDVDNQWQYRGRPVTVKFVIRTEDERNEVGNLISRDLQKVGFAVWTQYKDYSSAIQTVYMENPADLSWHLYTEGWVRGSSERYDAAGINSFCAPWMANMPGQLVFGHWQYRNSRLDDLGKKLLMGDFSSKEERDQIYREMDKICREEAVRVGVVTIQNTFPAKKELSYVTEDIVAGPTSRLTLRNAYIPGKNMLRVGNLYISAPNSVWNPEGGFVDKYSVDIWKNMYDPAIINHPFTGIPMPFRAGYEVETAGQNAKLTVPEDAVRWDAASDKWMKVASGTTAKSKVTFDFSKYFQSKWHNGQPITMADVLYSIAGQFERTYDTSKRQIELETAAVRQPILDIFRGFRVLDENRLEVYLDYWHFDPNYIAAYANVTAMFDLQMPWEILAAMDSLVFHKKRLVYSQTAKGRTGKPWLSLVVKLHATDVKNELADFRSANFLPANVFTVGDKTYAKLEDALARYQADLEWFAKYGHMVISQGPFMLTRYEPPQYAELTAFRDPTYPYKPGDWYFGKPEEIRILPVGIPRLNPEATNAISVTVRGPGTLALNYALVEPATGKVAALGLGTPSGAGEFKIELDSATLSQYRGKTLELVILASSDRLALLKEKRVELSVP